MITLNYNPSKFNHLQLLDNALNKWNRIMEYHPTDIEIYIVVDNIYSGEENIKAQTRYAPEYIHNGFPITGMITIDSDDLEIMEADGTLEYVVSHEIAHALGFGLFWKQEFLDISNLLYKGQNTLELYKAISGDSNVQGVPIVIGDNDKDIHWDPYMFEEELMTPYVGKFISRLTIASFEDMGYRVNYNITDDPIG